MISGLRVPPSLLASDFQQPERRVRGLRPAERIIALDRLGRADLADLGEVVGDVLLVAERLGDQAAVDVAVERAFLARAVVADRSRRTACCRTASICFQVIDQPADLVVGIGQIAGIDFHEARIELLLVGRERGPGLDRRDRDRAGPRCAGMMPSRFCWAKTCWR